MSETTLSGNRPESSLQIWKQLLDSLRRSGFREAGPEYLKLSKLVAEVRRRQVVSGCEEQEEPVWQKLSELGCEAHALLAPLTEAAHLLAELPLKVSITPLPPASAGAASAVCAPCSEQPVCATVAALQTPPSGERPAAPTPQQALAAPGEPQEASRPATGAVRASHRRPEGVRKPSALSRPASARISSPKAKALRKHTRTRANNNKER
jgi:hypothetical protein